MSLDLLSIFPYYHFNNSGGFLWGKKVLKRSRKETSSDRYKRIKDSGSTKLPKEVVAILLVMKKNPDNSI